MKFFSVLLRNTVLWTVVGLVCSILCIPNTVRAQKERYDIVYLASKDIERVLDYKDEVETVLDRNITKKLRIVAHGDEYALTYNANASFQKIPRLVIQHAEILRSAGFDEPYAINDKKYNVLYNVSYGLGPNLEPLKEMYEKVYSCLGEEVKQELFIERTAHGNYTLIYRFRGSELETTAVAEKQARILRGKGLSATLTRENNNEVVYGESSLINDGGSDNPEYCEVEPSKDAPKDTHQEVVSKNSTNQGAGNTKAPAKTVKPPPPVVVEKKKSPRKNLRPSAPGSIDDDVAEDPKTAVKVENIPVVDEEPEVIKAIPKIVKIKAEDLPRAVAVRTSHFERSIEDYIDTLRSKGVLGKDESTGWMVYDLEKDESLVDINADQEFQAASMIKPFVALAFFHQVKKGKIQYGPESRRKLEAMIQRSNNSATNWAMRMVGGPQRCDAILRDHYGSIFKKTEIREYIPANGRTYRNTALPSDYVRFLRALWNRQLPYGKELRRLMALPGRDRLYYGTSIPRGTLVYNKTGSTARLCGDMGILVPKTKGGGRFPYAIVGIIERDSRASNYGQWMNSRSKVIRAVSDLIYNELKKERKLL